MGAYRTQEGAYRTQEGASTGPGVWLSRNLATYRGPGRRFSDGIVGQRFIAEAGSDQGCLCSVSSTAVFRRGLLPTYVLPFDRVERGAFTG